MRSLLTIVCAAAVVALFAGCGSQQAATPAAKPAAAPEQKPAEQPAAQAPAPETAPAPAAEPAKQPEQGTVEIKAVDANTGKTVELDFNIIYFDFDKYNIKPEFQGAIEHNAGLVKGEPNLKLIIEGHCDERGTTEYNLALGEHRAVAVMKAMIAAGAGKGQLKTISYGKERPVDPGHTEAAWAKNRRSVVRNAAG